MKTLTQEREEIVKTVIADPPVGIGLRRYKPKRDPGPGVANYKGDCPVCGEEDKFTLTITVPGKRILYGCYRCRYMPTPKGQVPRPGIDYHEMLRDSELVIYPGDFVDESGEYVFPGELPKPKPPKQRQLETALSGLLGHRGPMSYRQLVEWVEQVGGDKPSMKVSERTLRRAIHRLVEDGKIVRHRERRANGTRGPVSYSLVEAVGFDFDRYVPERIKAGVA